jgi:membrane protease YdiL (CAAX protease family)
MPNARATSADDYWQQSRRPFASLVFTLPLLALYELGVILYPRPTIRNGADAWLRQLLDWVGFGEYFLLPLLTVGILLAWHHTTGEPWRVRRETLWRMFLESAMYAFVLLIVAAAVLYMFQGRVFFFVPHPGHETAETPISIVASLDAIGPYISRVISYFGAGVYEELMFRVLLLPAVLVVIQTLTNKSDWSLAAAVVLTSLAFSAAHYIGPYGDELDGYSFVFRFVAGAIFALLFVRRGFGIVVGTHALYDIFAAAWR